MVAAANEEHWWDPADQDAWDIENHASVKAETLRAGNYLGTVFKHCSVHVLNPDSVLWQWGDTTGKCIFCREIIYLGRITGGIALCRLRDMVVALIDDNPGDHLDELAELKTALAEQRRILAESESLVEIATSMIVQRLAE